MTFHETKFHLGGKSCEKQSRSGNVPRSCTDNVVDSTLAAARQPDEDHHRDFSNCNKNNVMMTKKSKLPTRCLGDIGSEVQKIASESDQVRLSRL